jgi:hypothetical protein
MAFMVVLVVDVDVVVDDDVVLDEEVVGPAVSLDAALLQPARPTASTAAMAVMRVCARRCNVGSSVQAGEGK